VRLTVLTAINPGIRGRGSSKKLGLRQITQDISLYLGWPASGLRVEASRQFLVCCFSFAQARPNHPDRQTRIFLITLPQLAKPAVVPQRSCPIASQKIRTGAGGIGSDERRIEFESKIGIGNGGARVTVK